MSNFPDKYVLTRDQNLFLARKKWDENVYCGMKMENRNLTFPQTQTILNGVNVADVTLDDIQAILNMRDAWRYLLKNINIPISLTFLCKINEFVARNEALEWGVLRSGRVGISGVEYEPPVPDEYEVTQELSELLEAEMSNTERAIITFLWGARRQIFWDGNKRTALLLANKLLITHGNGMLTIQDKNMERFNNLLVAYYNTGDMDALKVFLYDYAIFGLDLKMPEKKEPIDPKL